MTISLFLSEIFFAILNSRSPLGIFIAPGICPDLNSFGSRQSIKVAPPLSNIPFAAATSTTVMSFFASATKSLAVISLATARGALKANAALIIKATIKIKFFFFICPSPLC